MSGWPTPIFAIYSEGNQAMNTTALGRTGLEVSRLGFGLAEIGSLQAADGEAQAGRLLNAAIDSGINFLHPSFADIGGDGYDHSNPRGQQFGLCSTPQVSASWSVTPPT